ncbi:MAG: hypothetical protein U5R31_13745 [Acidimicrobiia bacterium]|nr:hypothetical protein [Acidimicrobiia bacterium]
MDTSTFIARVRELGLDDDEVLAGLERLSEWGITSPRDLSLPDLSDETLLSLSNEELTSYVAAATVLMAAADAEMLERLSARESPTGAFVRQRRRSDPPPAADLLRVGLVESEQGTTLFFVDEEPDWWSDSSYSRDEVLNWDIYWPVAPSDSVPMRLEFDVPRDDLEAVLNGASL